MKNFVIFANCQNNALALTLLENNEFSSKYLWSEIPPIQNVTRSDVDDIVKKVRDADLFIYQPIAISPYLPVEMTSNFLKSQLRDNVTAISFPSMYFDGYFPHLQTLKGLVSTLNLVHDYFIAYACAIGLEEQQVLSLIKKDVFYPRQLSKDLAAKSIENLRNRENQNNVEIKLSEFIETNYKNKKLFNQFNHPKRDVLRFVAESILTKIDIENYKIEPQGKGYLDVIMTPIYRSTYNNLKLKFEEDFNIYNGLNNSRLTQEDVVYRFFKFYKSNINLRELKEIVISCKPFVAEIMESFDL
jgi:hypothetical protein